MPRYVPASSQASPRFIGSATFARLPWVQHLQDVDLAVAGVPLDTGVTRRAGGRFGPNAVRAALVMLRPVAPLPRDRGARRDARHGAGPAHTTAAARPAGRGAGLGPHTTEDPAWT